MQHNTQVLVVGAGAAGSLAAAAAARAGAATVLLEAAPQPGGAGRAQRHRHLCGLFANGGDSPAPLPYGPAVAELVARLQARPPHARPQRMGRTWVWPLEDGDLASALAGLLADAPGLQREWGWRVEGLAVDRNAGRPRVTAVRDGERVTWHAQAVVDATGSAALAAAAGWPREVTPEGIRQLAGYTVPLSRIDRAEDELLPLRVPMLLRRACDAGDLPDALRHSIFIPTGPQTALLRVNLPDTTSAETAQALACDALRLLARACPAFADAAPGPAADPEPRDRGRIQGRYRLTAEDVLGAADFPDAVARGAWPMECWLPDRGPVYRYAPDGASYGIPLRCLLSPASEFVLFPGRSLACDPEAFGSVRVMGLCMATGEAAGRAAAERAS